MNPHRMKKSSRSPASHALRLGSGSSNQPDSAPAVSAASFSLRAGPALPCASRRSSRRPARCTASLAGCAASAAAVS